MSRLQGFTSTRGAIVTKSHASMIENPLRFISDDEFERMTLAERVAYLSAVAERARARPLGENVPPFERLKKQSRDT